MSKKTAANAVLCVLIAVLTFCLGYLFGVHNKTSDISVSVTPGVSAVEETEAVSEPQGPVNLNTADQEELEYLPGIGPSIAAKILAYREKHGAFKNIEQIVEVEGIGEKKFEAMKELITIGGTP